MSNYKIQETPIEDYAASGPQFLSSICINSDYDTYYKGLPSNLLDANKAAQLLNGGWVNSTAVSGYKYTSAGKHLPIVHKSSAVFPDRDTTKNIFDTNVGTYRAKADTYYQNDKTIYVRHNASYVQVKEDSGDWQSIGQHSNSFVFIDLCGGSGGGGGCYGDPDWGFGGGGGGGGGAYAALAIDLAKSGQLTIFLGKGGQGGMSSPTEKNVKAGGSGTASYIAFSDGTKIVTCGGAGGGGKGQAKSGGSGGSGGTAQNHLGDSLTSINTAKGIYFISMFHGKSGGKGGANKNNLNGDGEVIYENTPGGSFRYGYYSDTNTTYADCLPGFGIVAGRPIGYTEAGEKAGSDYAGCASSVWGAGCKGGGGGACAMQSLGGGGNGDIADLYNEASEKFDNGVNGDPGEVILHCSTSYTTS